MIEVEVEVREHNVDMYVAQKTPRGLQNYSQYRKEAVACDNAIFYMK
jgi:hypothetical protein